MKLSLPVHPRPPEKKHYGHRLRDDLWGITRQERPSYGRTLGRQDGIEIAVGVAEVCGFDAEPPQHANK